MLNKKLGSLLIALPISLTNFSFYRGSSFKPFQQPRIPSAQLKYQQPIPIMPQPQLGKSFLQKQTPLFKQPSYMGRDQKRFFADLTEQPDLLFNLPASKMPASFDIVPQTIAPIGNFAIIPLIKLLPKNQQEQDAFIHDLLQKTIDKIDKKNYLAADFTLPIYLVQILGSYAANKNNIYQIPTIIDFKDGKQRVSLDTHSFNKELENKVENFILKIIHIKFPLAKGLWAMLNRKSLFNLTEPDYLEETQSILLMFVFEKEMQMAHEIIVERKKHGNYDPKTLETIEIMLADVQKKFQELFDRSQMDGIYLKNYRETIRSSIWDILKEYVKKHYYDNKLLRIQKNMPDGTDTEYESETE